MPSSLLIGDAREQLAKKFDVSVANYWPATPQQPCRELDRLEGAGLLTARVIRRERRPNRRVFRIAATGRAEPPECSRHQAKLQALRTELIVQVQASDSTAILRSIRDRKAAPAIKVKKYERLRDDVLDGRTDEDSVGSSDDDVYPSLARDIAYEKENTTWCKLASDIIGQREQISGASAVAAVKTSE